MKLPKGNNPMNTYSIEDEDVAENADEAEEAWSLYLQWFDAFGASY